MKIRALVSVVGFGFLLATGCSSPTAPRLPPAEEDEDPRSEKPPTGAFADRVGFEILV